MAVVLYFVRTAVSSERDAEFNRWYDVKHAPRLLRFPGALSARRYKAISRESKYHYLAVYEFRDQPAFEAWLKSDLRRVMSSDHRARFGPVIEASASAYTQIWSSGVLGPMS